MDRRNPLMLQRAQFRAVVRGDFHPPLIARGALADGLATNPSR